MSELAFIADVVKGLKEEYPISIVLGRTTGLTVNPATGVQAETASEVTIRKAIKMPNNQTLAFMRAMGQGVKGMELIATTVQIILDLDDVPTGFDLKGPGTYATFSGRRHNVIDAEVYEYAAVIFCRKAQ